MCVIIYKPVGVKMPDEKVIRRCFKSNPHGAGIMWAKDGVLHIRKGLMTYPELAHALNDVIHECNHKTKSIPIVIHCRISTSGSTTPEYTHPYPLTRSYDEMKELYSTPLVGIAHNGVFGWSSATKHTEYNDSMEFVKKVAFNLVGPHGELPDKGDLEVLRTVCSGSRVIFMNRNGDVVRTGIWTTDKETGLIFSNMLWSYRYPWVSI